MLTVTLLCVGKLKETYWRDTCAEYAKRMGPFCRFSLVEVEEHRLPERPSAAEIQAGLAAEGRRLLQKAGRARIVALCIEGKTLSSPELACVLETSASSGVSSIAFVIGSSYGLSEEVKAAAFLRLSMSRMTFPHQLARVMLCEQLYRSFQILSDGRYHK